MPDKQFSRLKLIESILPGKTSAYDEYYNYSEYASRVFVHNASLTALKSRESDKLLFVGGKGCGKTSVFLQAKKAWAKKAQQDDGVRIYYAFANAARTKCRGAIDGFRNLASQVHAHSHLHDSTSIREAFRAISPVFVERNWLHILAFATLEALDGKNSILDACSSRSLKRRLRKNIRQYKRFELWNCWYRFWGRIFGWLQKWHLSFNIPFLYGTGINVEHDSHTAYEIDPRDVLDDVNAALESISEKKNQRHELRIVVDTVDEVLGRLHEVVRFCLLSNFMELALNWGETYRHISLKILIRADYAISADYDNMDRIVDQYHVISMEQEQFHQLILRRLLYATFNQDQELLDGSGISEEVLKCVYSIYEKKIQDSVIANLNVAFQLFFGSKIDLSNSLAAPTASDIPPEDKDSADKYSASEQIYNYFLDGKGSIALRHVIIFISMCKKSMSEDKSGSTDDDPLTSSKPLFPPSIVEDVLLKYLPGIIFNQIDREFPVIRGNFEVFKKLARDQDEFKKEDAVECLKKIEGQTGVSAEEQDDSGNASPRRNLNDDPWAGSADSVFNVLFHAGLIAGDARNINHCSKFWFPIFVRHALLSIKLTEENTAS